MIEVEQLGKTFRERGGGVVHAVEGVSFTCQPGEIFGLLGPNGAGKTTTLRVISTALRPTTGKVRVLGHDAADDPSAVRRAVGFLSASTGLYGRLTARELLNYFGSLFGMERERLKARIAEVAALFELAEFLDRPCDKLSSGMKQRLSIARSVLHDPPVMILDEPTTGLDVLTSRHIIQFIRTCRDQGKTVLFSTHIMSEVSRLCDRVGVIHRGRLTHEGTVPEIRSKFGDDLEEAFLAMIGERAT